MFFNSPEKFHKSKIRQCCIEPTIYKVQLGQGQSRIITSFPTYPNVMSQGPAKHFKLKMLCWPFGHNIGICGKCFADPWDITLGHVGKLVVMKSLPIMGMAAIFYVTWMIDIFWLSCQKDLFTSIWPCGFRKTMGV